ncbi:MAG: sporulation protein YqfD [Oscillospiraceae bacterium]
MEKAVERLRGYVEVSVSGGNPEKFLNLSTRRGILLTDCRSLSEVELRCIIPRRYIRAAEDCANKTQCELKVLRRRGASFTIGKVRRRYFLLAGLFTVLLLLGVSSLHIWDIEVVGNETVSKAEILNVLEDCGVYIGANWTEFRSDLIRSEALERLQNLSFLTVNVKGSRATVIVRERIPVPEMDYDREPCDIVAEKNGVIDTIHVFRGKAAVSRGSAVLKGDVLISGAVPGISETNQVSAFGEIKAQTYYTFSASESLEMQKKVPTGREARNYAIIFGGNRLNFYRNTGIFRDDCDTIYNEWKLEVKGLFTLPITVVRETRAQYELTPASKDPAEVETRLKNLLAARLKREVGETAEIETYDFAVREDGDALTVTLRATCLEAIGVKQPTDDLLQPREEDGSQ